MRLVVLPGRHAAEAVVGIDREVADRVLSAAQLAQRVVAVRRAAEVRVVPGGHAAEQVEGGRRCHARGSGGGVRGWLPAGRPGDVALGVAGELDRPLEVVLGRRGLAEGVALLLGLLAQGVGGGRGQSLVGERRRAAVRAGDLHDAAQDVVIRQGPALGVALARGALGLVGVVGLGHVLHAPHPVVLGVHVDPLSVEPAGGGADLAGQRVEAGDGLAPAARARPLVEGGAGRAGGRAAAFRRAGGAGGQRVGAGGGGAQELRAAGRAPDAVGRVAAPGLVKVAPDLGGRAMRVALDDLAELAAQAVEAGFDEAAPVAVGCGVVVAARVEAAGPGRRGLARHGHVVEVLDLGAHPVAERVV